MLLRQKSSGHMVKVLDLVELMDLHNAQVSGQLQEGEEEQDTSQFDKSDLAFLSGEALPRCWIDPHYRDDEVAR